MRMIFAPLLLFALIACRPLDVGAPVEAGGTPALAALDAAAPMRGDQRGGVRLIDGDTFEMNGETIRISNIDTPEMAPRSRCLAEERLAKMAKEGLGDVMELSWGAIPNLQRQGTDRYGRTLAAVTLANGVDVGDEMVRRGYAQPWGGRRADWCGTA